MKASKKVKISQRRVNELVAMREARREAEQKEAEQREADAA